MFGFEVYGKEGLGLIAFCQISLYPPTSDRKPPEAITANNRRFYPEPINLEL
jgi:hypothetical protein